MRNFQHTFEKCTRSFISVFSICMTVPLTSEATFGEIMDLMWDWRTGCGG